MPRERWGTFSVIDHSSVEMIVPEILLYDRLVIPTPYDPNSNFDDRARWESLGWDPEGLQKRLDQLGNIAVKKNWDQVRQQTFISKLDELKQTQNEIDNFALTRWLLASEKQPRVSLGETKPLVVAAYPSETEFRRDFTLIAAPNAKKFEAAYLGVLLRHRIAFPITKPNDEETLKKTIDLVNSPNFPKKRRALYDWQEQVINNEYTAGDAMSDMELLIDDYNRFIERSFRDVSIKYACTVALLAFSILGGAAINPLLAAGAIVPIIQLIAVDGRPVEPPQETKPAAMFHDVEKLLG